MDLTATGSYWTNCQVMCVRSIFTRGESKIHECQEASSDIEVYLNCRINHVTKTSALGSLTGKVTRYLGL